MTFAEKLKNIRKQAGMSQEQLAEKLGVSRQAVTKWETDAGIPDIENIMAISALFDISIDELLSNEKGTKKPTEYLFESVTEYDIDEQKRFDMKFGGAKQFALSGYKGEKIRVRLASNTLSTLQNDFKVKIDDIRKRIDVDVNRRNGISEAMAKEAICIFVQVPSPYIGKIECAVNAETVEIRSLECDSIELDVKTPNIILDDISGTVEINCNLDMEVVCHSLKGEVDINQISATSRILIPEETVFTAVTKGIGTSISYEKDGRQTERFDTPDAENIIELTGIPVVTTIMGKGAVPTEHSLYVGNLGIHGSFAANSTISNCDVLFSIGTRFNDRITGKIEEFAADAKIIHIDIDAASISRNIVVDVPIVADAKKAICTLLKKAEALPISEWVDEINRWKKEYPIDMGNSGLTPQMVIKAVNEIFTDAVVTTDVGQNQLWATQFLALDENRQMLTSGGLGTMGYGFPAAIGAKLGNPHKDVVVITGDGGMQMNIQEMATAVVYELPIIICILNNGYLGNVRQWQEMFYDRRYSSTCMRYRRCCETGCNNPMKECPEYTPDFIRLAESYGAKGIRVTKAEDIKAAFEMAGKNTKAPTVIEFIIDREANVMPIVPPGNPLDDMILESEGRKL